MENRHIITGRDQWFLDKHMKDPVTQETFKLGDTIIICADCRTAHYASTWGYNPDKCCSICEGNRPLYYIMFSPALFQHKVPHSKEFKITVEKLSFLQRLKLFDCSLAAKVIAILLPIALIGMLGNSIEEQADWQTGAVAQLSIVQDKAFDFGERNYDKAKEVIDKREELTIDFSGFSSKLDSTLLSVENTKYNFKKKDIGEKFQDLSTIFRSVFKQISDKATSVFNKVSEAYTHNGGENM